MITRILNTIRHTRMVIAKYRPSQLWGTMRSIPRIMAPHYRMDAAFRRAATKGRNPIIRLARSILNNGRGVRPFMAGAFERRRFRRAEDHWRMRALKMQPQINMDAFNRIKNLFGTNVRYNKSLIQDEFPPGLDGYDIGHFIAKGCMGAVYALRRKQPGREMAQDRIEMIDEAERIEAEKAISVYPLALKLMFNYQLDRTLNDDHLWREMGAELAPLPNSNTLLQGRMGKYKPVPARHPNIVKIHTAFVDRLEVLPGAYAEYPEALPDAFDMNYSEPRTLYVVMKRYRMTLREYVHTHKRVRWIGQVLLGQLLEGCVFLHDNVISHRDMKSDNLLLQFDDDDEPPHLVISDFGCALATGSWKVPYRDTTADLGGNRALMAPEISSAEPSENMVLDFRLADTWSAGTLAYEIFTRVNPFYSRLKTATYLESDLPPLSRNVNYAIRDAVRGLLRRDPEERLLPHVAANVVALSLFRFGYDVQAFFKECGIDSFLCSSYQLKDAISKSLRALGTKADEALDSVLQLYAAESIVVRTQNPPVVSDAELQLRATFLARIDRAHVWEAVAFFFNKPFEDHLSLNSLNSLSSNSAQSTHAGIVFNTRVRSR